jgi:hypothetical protein
VYPNFKFAQETKKLKHMLVDEKSTFHLLIKSQAKIDKKQDQKVIVDTIIKHVCSLKTLHGLKPLTRYDANHCKSTSIANGFETSKEELAIDGKQKKWSKPLEKKGRITQRHYLLLSRREVVPIANK